MAMCLFVLCKIGDFGESYACGTLFLIQCREIGFFKIISGIRSRPSGVRRIEAGGRVY